MNHPPFQKPTFFILALTALLFIANSKASANHFPVGTAVHISNDSSFVYQSSNLHIKKLSAHVYQHISFLNTNSFGRVECNGMVVVNNKEAIVFDTPTDDKSSAELISYLSKQLGCTIKAIVPTHFHEDCVGGLESFRKKKIPAFASSQTIALLQAKDPAIISHLRSFDNSMQFTIGGKKVYAEYFGEGHTKDNVIGYFPDDNAVFGGCLIKEMNATKGFLGDANLIAWPETVQKLKQKYPNTKIVIPGHGKSGGSELFDYTIKLFQQ
ncbi:MAG: subclass B1 metallo-beta-lactamase [Chitinophagaceae bacterium]|nr:MAG: subclass B1 metallo-beta-lactamase [Chitinophagaceae bacterium]